MLSTQKILSREFIGFQNSVTVIKILGVNKGKYSQNGSERIN